MRGATLIQRSDRGQKTGCVNLTNYLSSSSVASWPLQKPMMTSVPSDLAQGAPTEVSPLSQSVGNTQHTKQSDGFNADDTQMGSSHNADSDLRGRTSTMSQSQTLTPSRGGTLKKRQSLSKKASLKRKDSGKRSRAASVRSLGGEDRHGFLGDQMELNNAFYTPVPTTGNPTEILANRFQGTWRCCSWACGISWLTYSCSLAQGAQRSHHILPRHPEIL